MIDLFQGILSVLDPILVFWALVLNVLGFYLKKVGLPKAAPPIPLLLFLVAFVPCFVLGWTTAPSEGSRAALYAVFYGLSNGALITLPAIFGYDVVHAFTGRTAQERRYRFTLEDRAVNSPRLKGLVYGVTAFIAAVTAGCTAYFAFDEPIFYVICWMILFVGVSVVIARTVLHIVMGDLDPEMFAVSIYAAGSCGAWLGLILCDSWLWTSIWGAVLVGTALAALGTRFLDPVDEDELPEAEKPRRNAETDSEFLCRTLRFKLAGDRLDGAPIPDQPLCEVRGHAMTVDEAEADGCGAIAAEGLEYIKMLLKEGK